MWSMADLRHALTLRSKGKNVIGQNHMVIKCQLCVYSLWQTQHPSAYQFICLDFLIDVNTVKPPGMQASIFGACPKPG